MGNAKSELPTPTDDRIINEIRRKLSKKPFPSNVRQFISDLSKNRGLLPTEISHAMGNKFHSKFCQWYKGKDNKMEETVILWLKRQVDQPAIKRSNIDVKIYHPDLGEKKLIMPENARLHDLCIRVMKEFNFQAISSRLYTYDYSTCLSVDKHDYLDLKLLCKNINGIIYFNNP